MKKVACAKCGGAMKKMAKGGSMKTTVGSKSAKSFIAGIPNSGPTGPNYQGVATMKKGGAIKKMAVGGKTMDCPKGQRFDGTRCVSTASPKIAAAIIGSGIAAGAAYIAKKSKANRDARQKEKEEVKRYAKTGGMVKSRTTSKKK